jgi:hypothetical protein
VRILDGVVDVILAVVPSAGMLFLFWRALKAIVEGDRRERAAEARWNREHGDGATDTATPAGDLTASADKGGSTEGPTAG